MSPFSGKVYDPYITVFFLGCDFISIVPKISGKVLFPYKQLQKKIDIHVYTVFVFKTYNKHVCISNGKLLITYV